MDYRPRKKRTPREAAQAQERAERRAIAQAARDAAEPWDTARDSVRDPGPYSAVDLDAALRDPRNWRYPAYRPKGPKGPR